MTTESVCAECGHTLDAHRGVRRGEDRPCTGTYGGGCGCPGFALVRPDMAKTIASLPARASRSSTSGEALRKAAEAIKETSFAERFLAAQWLRERALSPVEYPGEEGAESKTCERCGYVGGGGWLPGWDTDPTAGTQPRGMKCPDCNPAPAAAESTRADLAEIERLVSKYGRAIVYGGNGLKALEARATLLSAIRSLAAPEGKRHG